MISLRTGLEALQIRRSCEDYPGFRALRIYCGWEVRKKQSEVEYKEGGGNTSSIRVHLFPCDQLRYEVGIRALFFLLRDVETEGQKGD